MMVDESLPQTGEPRKPPPCERCLTREGVTAILLTDVFDGVEYWHCIACGRVWGTRYGKPMKEAWA